MCNGSAVKLTYKINSADMLPVKVKGVHLLAIKTNSDVEMTYNKLTKVHMVNESQVCTLLLMPRRVNSILCKSM